MKRLVLVAVLVCMVSPAWAANSKGGFQMLGPGGKSCGFWVKQRAIGGWPSLQVSAWISGFLTAYNLYKPGVYDVTQGIDVEGRSAWIDNYCSQNPLHSISNAGDAFINHLVSR